MSDFDDEPLEWQNIVRELAAGVPALEHERIEPRLQAAVRRRGLRRRLRIGLAGMAACLAIFVLGWRLAIPQPLEQSSADFAGFVALPYAQSDVPMEQAVVVGTTLAPNDLESLGLPHALLNGPNGVHVELLIGQDGVARAVRLPER